jgi:dihydrofolate reductase
VEIQVFARSAIVPGDRKGIAMKLTLHTFLTIDGVMQAPGGADEDTTGGFSHGGWLVPFADQDMGTIVNGWFEKADAILLGRTTYDAMFPYWSQVTDPGNIAGVKLNAQPKYVVSGTLRDPKWHDTTVLSGNVIEHVTKLKNKPGGELQIHGSCILARALHRAGLIDEYRLLVFPVAVGHGKRLFTDDAPATGFRLTDSATTSTGAVYSALTPALFEAGTAEVVGGREVV